MASSDLEQKLLKQIEFYFSDSNFRNDKFLRAKAAENSDGYVSVQVLTTFNRVKSMTEDVMVIAKSLEASTTLELSTDRTAVRRTKPLPEDDDSQQRLVYVVSNKACENEPRLGCREAPRMLHPPYEALCSFSSPLRSAEGALPRGRQAGVPAGLCRAIRYCAPCCHASH
jgi:hypothetical protein